MRPAVAWGSALALIVALTACGSVRWPLSAVKVGDSLNAAFGASPRLHWRAPQAASFTALPWPSMRIVDARLDDVHGVNLLAAPSARLDLSLIDLLRGRFIPKGAVLASPAIALDIDRPPFAGAAGGPAGPASVAGALAPLTSLSLSNGVLRLVSARRGLDLQIDKVRGRLDGLTIGGRLSFSLSARWRNTPFAVIGALTDPEAAAKGVSSPLAFGLDSPLVKLAFGGVIAFGDKLGADGDLTASAPSIAALAALFHLEPPALLAAGDLTVTGKVKAQPDALTLGEARLTRAGQTLEGALAIGDAGGRPAVSGTLAADTLALEPLLGPPERFFDPSGAWSAKPFAFAPPRAFDLDLRLSAADLDAYGLALTNAAASATVTDGEFNLNLIEATAYGGRLEGEASAIRVGRDLRMSATAELADADLGGAVASFGRPLATGRGEAKIAVEASAASPAAAIANLAGTASIEARDGSILGVNLEEALRRSRRRPIDVWRDMRLGGTAFDKLEVSLALADGRARVERGAMVSRGMTARLNGLIDLVAESWALRLTAVQTDAAGEVSQDAAHLTLDIRGPWSASKVRVIGAGGSTDKAGARAPSRRSRRGGRLVERSLIGDPATLITKGRALPDPRADWLASSAKLRVGDNTGVRPSRAGFAFENEAAVARRSVGEFFSWASRRGRKLAVDETGTPAVEFAMVFPIFLAIVLATLQAATIFLVKAFFESTAEEAARTVLTNQVGSLTAAQFQTEICNELTALFDCSEVTVELEPLPAGTTNLASLLPTFDSSGNVVGSPTVDVGVNSAVPGTDMLLVVMYPWPVFGGPLGLNFANMGNGKMLMTSTQVFRVEPTVPAG